MEFIFGLFVIFIIVGSTLGFRSFTLKKKILELQGELSLLKKRVDSMERAAVFPETESVRQNPEASETDQKASKTADSEPPSVPYSEHSKLQTETSSVERPYKKKRLSRALFQDISDRFSDRWTGILGVTALVIGFSFLAVLTALRMGPVARFFMIAGISLAFWLGSLFMERKKARTDISCWFQSASGALILFACLGASSIPWLRWAESEIQGYAMMFTGIAVNLYFALRVQTQLFSSFHTLISLAALAVAPSSPASLSAAALVTAFSSIPVIQRKWGLHQLLAQTGYFVFIVIWISLGRDMELFSLTGIDLPVFAALLGGMLPGLAAPYIQLYRGEYKSDRFSFSARAASWVYVAAGTFALGGRYSWTSIIFMLLGLSAYLSGRFIKQMPVPLRRLDSIAGVLMVFGAIIGLRSFQLDYFTAAGMGGMVALLAALDGRREKLLRTVFSAAAFAASLILFAYSTGELMVLTFVSKDPQQILGSMVILYAFTAASFILTKKVFSSFTPASILLSLAAGTGSLGVFLLSQAISFLPVWITVGGGIVLPLIALSLFGPSARIGRLQSRINLALVILIHSYSFLLSNTFFRRISGAPDISLNFIILSLAAALLLIQALKQKLRTLPAVLLVTIDLFCFIEVTIHANHEWFMFVLWAILSMVQYGIYRIPSLDRGLRKSLSTTGTGLSLLTALLVLASTKTVYPIDDYSWWQRSIQGVSVFGALLIWNIRTVKEREGVRKWLLFASALFVTLFVILETSMTWGAVICITAALVMQLSGKYGPPFIREYRPLSLILFWAGMLILPLSGIEKGEFFIEVFGLPWWAALGSIVLSLLYIVSVYLLDEDRSIGLLSKLLRSKKSGSLLYPYYAGIGVFLFLSFSGPVLTSLLILESLALFVPGILLKENSFRISSFLLILFCLIRLIFIDMARTDTLERAVVFILAGAVLLGMNWMYGRFAGKR